MNVERDNYPMKEEVEDLTNMFGRNHLQYKYQNDSRSSKYERQTKFMRKDNSSFSSKSNSSREYRKPRGGNGSLKSTGHNPSRAWNTEGVREQTEYNFSSNNSSRLSSRSLEQHDITMKNKSVERSSSYASSTGGSSTGSNYSSNKENLQNASAAPSNAHNKNPFRFEVSEEDESLCQQTNDRVYNLYQSVVLDEELLKLLQSTYMDIHQYLMQQQKNFCDFYEEKRKHEISNWLASMSETEQKRYYERNPSQMPQSQKS